MKCATSTPRSAARERNTPNTEPTTRNHRTADTSTTNAATSRSPPPPTGSSTGADSARTAPSRWISPRRSTRVWSKSSRSMSRTGNTTGRTRLQHRRRIQPAPPPHLPPAPRTTTNTAAETPFSPAGFATAQPASRRPHLPSHSPDPAPLSPAHETRRNRVRAQLLHHPLSPCTRIAGEKRFNVVWRR